MKRLSLFLAGLLLLTACGPSATETEALKIISDIPLPKQGYSRYTGKPLIYDPVKIDHYGYWTDTGEEAFEITCYYHEPDWYENIPIPLIQLYRPGSSGTVQLIIPNPENDKWTIGVSGKDQHVFSVNDLKKMHDYLVWR